MRTLKPFLVILWLMAGFHTGLIAQPCSAGNSCFDAPLLCGNVLNGFSGSTGPSNDITQPDIFCGIIENNEWIKFVACDPNVELELLIDNCAGTLTGSGLQAEIFETSDCSNFTSVSDCFNPAVEANGSLNASGLTPGNIYYLMLDGWAGDICDYQINIISGIDLSPPDPVIITNGAINGPASVCPGSQSSYTLTLPECGDVSQSGCALPELQGLATVYTWNIPPGASIVGDANSETITIQWGNTSGTLSVDINENLPSDCGCDWSCPAEIPDLNIVVNINPINSDTLPTVYLCDGDTYEFCDVMYSTTIDAICSDDCINAVIQPIIVLPTTYINLGTLPLCNGACFEINGEQFCGGGFYTSTFQDNSQCIISAFDLEEITVEGFYTAGGVLTPTQLDSELLGGGTTSTGGTLTYEWAGPGINPGNINEQNPTVTLPGPYVVTITDVDSGCMFTYTVFVLYQDNDCNLPVPPADSCTNAPLLCGENLDGYCSFTDNFTQSIPGNLQSVFCETIDNNSWLRFIPCEPDVSFEIVVPNCNIGQGIEIAVFQSDDCDDYQILSNCLSIDSMNTDTLIATGLTPGEIYYIMVDGQDGAHCEWEINILEGISIEPLSLEQTSEAMVSGPMQVCQGQVVEYIATPPVCELVSVDNCPYQSLLDSLIIEWTVPSGASILSGQGTDTLTVEWLWGPGGLVFVEIETAINESNAFCTSSNGCGSFASMNTDVEFVSTTLDPVYICEGDFYNYCGTNYSTTIDAVCGDTCSQVIQPIIVQTPQTNHLGVFQLCDGDCYTYQSQDYCADDIYEFLVPNGPCVDTVRFEIELIQEPRFYLSEVIEDCDAFGTSYNIVFEIVDGVPPFYVNGQLQFSNLFQSSPILSGDPYNFEISQSAVCSDSTIVISGEKSCACQTLAGTMQQDLIVDCEGESVSAQHLGNELLDGDDAFEYVLHNGPDSFLVDPLDINLSGTFEFIPGVMEYGQTYYISYVAGNAIDGGFVDLNALCLQVSLGQPVVFFPRPIANAGLDSIIDCNNPSIQLGGAIEINTSPSVSFVWTGPNGFEERDSLNPFTTSQGTYTLTVMDSVTGCTSLQSIDINPNFIEPDLSANGGELSCFFPEIQLTSSSVSAIDFEWETPNGVFISQQNPMVNEPGMYTLTSTGSNGCTSSLEVMVENNIIIPDIETQGGELNCNSPIFLLNAITNASQPDYLWIGPNNFDVETSSAQTEVPGMYTINILDLDNGCRNDTSIFIADFIDYPFTDAGPNLELDCNSPSLPINSGNTASGENIVYSWTGPGGFMSTELSPQIETNGVYTLVVTDTSNQCTQMDEISVVSNFQEPIILEALGGVLNCDVTEVVLDGVTNGEEDIFLWVNTFGDTISSPQFDATIPGTYELIAIGPNGCRSVESIVVEDNFIFPVLTLNSENIDCYNPEVELSVASNLSDVTYNWQGPGITNNTNASINTSLPGIYEVSVVNNESLCETDTTLEILNNISYPLAEAGTAEQLTCSIFEIQLDGNESSEGNGLNYFWTNPLGNEIQNENSLEPTVESPGVYFLSVNNTENGCNSIDSVVVTEFENIPTVIELDINQPECFGDENGNIFVENSIGGIPPFSFSFNGNAFTNNSYLPGLGSGNYAVAILDANGCVYEENIPLADPPLVEVELGGDITIDLGDELTLTPIISISESEVFTIDWSNNLNETQSGVFQWTVSPTYGTSYDLVVADFNNCKDTASVNIWVNRELPVYIPNAFSPNGDGNNDIFYVNAGSSITNIKTFRIFDRWGELVHQADEIAPNDPAFGWNGLLKNREMIPAIYVYYVEVETFEGSVEVFKGDFLLVR